MPSKGNRRPYVTRVPDELGDLIEKQAALAGSTSVSQYLADLLAAAHGRPDLVREVGRPMLTDGDDEVMPLTA